MPRVGDHAASAGICRAVDLRWAVQRPLRAPDPHGSRHSDDRHPRPPIKRGRVRERTVSFVWLTETLTAWLACWAEITWTLPQASSDGTVWITNWIGPPPPPFAPATL